MSSKEISQILLQCFSSGGYDLSGFKLKLEHPAEIKIEGDKNNVILKFGNKQPKIEIKKLITFYAYIEAISLNENGGSIKLRHFPDIRFSHDTSLISLSEQNFGKDNSLYEEIVQKYSNNSTEQEIAKQCLHYAEEWATICGNSGMNFKEVDRREKQRLIKQCQKFVVENIKRDFANEKKYGSVIITYLLVFIVIPSIARFIVVRLLEKYF